MKTCPVIVLGHVDHGKTSLVRTLTGMETDRLPEEKARGLSITPGFAYQQYGDVMIDFIDAPGHSDFIRAMVSGASGARAALIVISAWGGVQEQTLEHLEIIEALGIVEGVVAVTQSDRISRADYSACEKRLREALSGTRFCTAPMVFCSSTNGHGISALEKALEQLGFRSVGTPPLSSTFLPIDRVFVVEGRGTVVTGTLHGGPVRADETLVLAPSGQSLTFRSIHVRGRDVSEASPGERTALNLRGISVDRVKPGGVIHAPGAFAPSAQCDVLINLSTRASRPVKHMQQVRVLHGTSHAVASLRLFEGKLLAPGASAFARLRFPEAITSFSGQRAVIRSLSPAETIGGATVIDPAPTESRANKKLRLETLDAVERGDIPRIAAALTREHLGVARIADICRLAPTRAETVRAELGAAFVDINDALVAASSTIEEVREGYIARLESYHAAFPLRPFAPREPKRVPHMAAELIDFVESALVLEGKLVLSGREAALSAHDPHKYLTASLEHRMARLARELKEAGMQPPSPEALIADAIDADLLTLLIHEGTAIRLNNISLRQTIVFHRDAVADAARTLKANYPGQTAFTTGEARATLNTTRKYIVPLLEHLDTKGMTIRIGNTRYMADV
jgi:selenocysteine-specific elongation factor